MTDKFENEELIHDFLFGRLAGQERDAFEERFVTDSGFFDEVVSIEDELIERYVRGLMDPAEREEFEKNFLTTKKKKEKVEFSKLLIERTRQQNSPAHAKQEDENTEETWIFARLSGLFASPQFALGTALAIVLVGIGGWFLYRSLTSDNSEIVKKDDTNVSVSPAPTSSPSIEETPFPEATPENSPEQPDNTDANQADITPTPNKSPVTKTPQPTKSPPPKAVRNPVLALFAGTLRSGGSTKVLDLPEGATGATLQLNLESNDYKIYRARLMDANGNVLYNGANLKASGTIINFSIPAKNLKNGDYMVSLDGKGDSGEFESVADFQFRVKK